jgi:hypothetical protein
VHLPGLGLRFIAEIERRQKVLLETPLVGHPYGRRLRKFTAGDKFPWHFNTRHNCAAIGEVVTTRRHSERTSA